MASVRHHSQCPRGGFAVASGVPRPNVVIADDGVVVDPLVDGRASIVGAIPAGYVYVDGRGVGDVGEQSLKDRLILGGDGFITIVVVVDSVTGKVTAPPEIFARGFSEDPAAFEGVLAASSRRRSRLLVATACYGLRRYDLGAAAGTPGRRKVGQRHLPTPPDDHSRWFWIV